MVETSPNGCAHCGLPERDHFQRWATGPGWHNWTQPTDQQRLERMRARRTGTTTTKETP